MENPFVSFNKNSRTYHLEQCFLTEAEWEKLRKKSTGISKNSFKELVSMILTNHGVSKRGYPQFTWTETGELSSINIGNNCACIHKLGDAYTFHNIDHPQEALAGLEIIVRYLDYVLKS